MAQSGAGNSSQACHKAYIYRPLETQGHFRLLEIRQSGNIHGQNYMLDEFDFDIRHFSIHNSPHYETLSYVWGDSTEKWSLELRDQSCISITNSLYFTLVRAAANCSTGFLWIDQISINQDDIAERNHQVALMGNIYRQCFRVIIWLGEDDFDPACAAFVRDVCHGARIRQERVDIAIGGEHYGSQDTLLERFATEELLTRGRIESQIEALIELYRRPWFTRAWVIQEAILPKNSLVLAGFTQLVLEDLAVMSLALMKMLDAKQRQIKGLTTLGHIGTGREQEKGISIRFKVPFHERLSQYSSRVDATDPRDLVYAFLAFQDDERIKIDVNYEASIDKVFIHTARAIICGREDLDLFGSIRHDVLPRKKTIALPSWAPDWSLPWECFPLSLGSNFCASKFRKYKVTGQMNDQKLEIHGRIIDRITNLPFPPPFTNNASKRDRLRDRLSLDFYYQHFRSLKNGDWPMTHERLLHTILADGVYRVQPDCHPLTSDKIRQLLDMYDRVMSAKRLQRLQRQEINFLELFLAPQKGRLLFAAESGRIGLGSKLAEEGDHIVIVHGSNTPLVLRDAGDDLFRMIGECYFEDAMYGEACTWPEEEADTFVLI